MTSRNANSWAFAVSDDRYAVADGTVLTTYDAAFKKAKSHEPFTKFRFKPTGHYRVANPADADEIVYVIQTDKGQETLTPAEFAKRTGWKNDPMTGFESGK